MLLDPHASAAGIESAANALLLQAGDTRAPMLLGGSRPVVVAARDRFDLLPLAKTAAPGVIAIGVAALVATLVASPTAFWRDSVAPTASTAISGQPPASHLRSEAPAGEHDPLATLAVAVPASAATTVGEDSPAPATRQLVLLVPELPPAPHLEPSVVFEPVVSVSPAPPSGSSKTLAVVPTPQPKSSEPSVRAEASGPGGLRHQGKHGDKDEFGHGSKAWGPERGHQGGVHRRDD